MMAFLERLLPPTFADLERPLAVGVVDPSGAYRLLHEGPLVPAVAASCAMPYVFEPIMIGGTRFQDGGAVDRLGVEAWRAWRATSVAAAAEQAAPTAIAHRVRRTAGVDVAADLSGIRTIDTPRSGASFLSLGDVRAQAAEARAIALSTLAS